MVTAISSCLRKEETTYRFLSTEAGTVTSFYLDGIVQLRRSELDLASRNVDRSLELKLYTLARAQFLLPCANNDRLQNNKSPR